MMKIIIFQGHDFKMSKVSHNKNIENFDFNTKYVQLTDDSAIIIPN